MIQLERIMKEATSPMYSVDVGLLHTNTVKVDFNSELLHKCTRLRYLHISGDDSKSDTLKSRSAQPGCYINESQSWLLLYCAPLEHIHDVINHCGASLELVDIRFTSVDEIDLSHLTGLLRLRAEHNKSLVQITGLKCLKSLQVLEIRGSTFLTELDLNNYDNLSKVDIFDTNIQEIILDHNLLNMSVFWASGARIINTEFVSFFPNIQNINLGHNPVQSLPDFSVFSNLTYLGLSGLPVKSLGATKFPGSLRGLWLTGSDLDYIPESIRSIEKLEILDLSKLNLSAFPEWLLDLELDFVENTFQNGICLTDTTAKGVDMSIFSQPREMITQWFDERKKGNEVLLNEIKVVFLGNGEVGKSHTIARLLNEGAQPGKSFSGSSTPGIAIENKEYVIDGQKVQVHFWDFGGQDILYSMHRMFLTKRTLYVILVDARNESKGNQAREWLDTVKSFADDAPVLLVVNKTDQNPAASIDEETLQRKYRNLKKVVYMSALTTTKEDFNTIFTDSMLELIRQSGSLEIKWPRKWTQVKTGLQNMEAPYIFSDAYETLCQECDVNENQINLLEWFNDLGVSFCQFRDYNLKDYVILRPDWMTNAIYTILFNKREEVENGMISLEEISNLLNPNEENKGKILQVVSNTKYTWQEINYVLDVVRKFRLSYSVSREMEFFPMLCKENSKPIAQDYAGGTDTLEFQMKFEYLPNNVLHRLMVERWTELDTENIWLTGARFVQTNTGLSAVVRIDKNILQIYVRSENQLHSPNTYLSVIEGSVDRIRQELKLPKPKNRLVYKIGDQRAEFDYERLLKMHAKGKETEYSDELDEDFNIRDILNQVAPAEVTEQERLLADLVKACGQLQSEVHYWDTKENPRNSYIRNALDNMGYVLRDQTLHGISGGETEEGELDLDIRRYKDVPWTICEALRVNSASTTDWNFHLKKLLDNYNPNGIRFLILLTYVDDKKDKFDQIWTSFKNHIQGHDEGGFAYQLNSLKHYQTEPWTANHYIQTAKCKYVLGEYTPTVYHIFVRMGR